MVYTKYPTQIDTSLELPVIVDLQTKINGEVLNRHRDAILAIESELGISPSREFGTLRDRLDAMESRISSGGVINDSMPAIVNSIARYSSPLGISIKDSFVILDDNDRMTGLQAVTLFGGGSNRIIIDSVQNNGFIGVGALSPLGTEKLNINGNSYLNGDCTVSDTLSVVNSLIDYGFFGVGISTPLGTEIMNIVGDSYLDGYCTVTGNLTVNGTVTTRGATFGEATKIDDGDSPYYILGTDSLILADTSSGNPVTVELPSINVSEGRHLLIVDWGNTSGTDAITINARPGETINGANTLDISTDGNALYLYCDGLEWRTIPTA